MIENTPSNAANSDGAASGSKNKWREQLAESVGLRVGDDGPKLKLPNPAYTSAPIEQITAADLEAKASGTAGYFEEDEDCPNSGCAGKLVFQKVVNCTCHISPPCSDCTSNKLECPTCHWVEGEPLFVEHGAVVEEMPTHFEEGQIGSGISANSAGYYWTRGEQKMTTPEKNRPDLVAAGWQCEGEAAWVCATCRTAVVDIANQVCPACIAKSGCVVSELSRPRCREAGDGKHVVIGANCVLCGMSGKEIRGITADPATWPKKLVCCTKDCGLPASWRSGAGDLYCTVHRVRIGDVDTWTDLDSGAGMARCPNCKGARLEERGPKDHFQCITCQTLFSATLQPQPEGVHGYTSIQYRVINPKPGPMVLGEGPAVDSGFDDFPGNLKGPRPSSPVMQTIAAVAKAAGARPTHHLTIAGLSPETVSQIAKATVAKMSVSEAEQVREATAAGEGKICTMIVDGDDCAKMCACPSFIKHPRLQKYRCEAHAMLLWRELGWTMVPEKERPAPPNFVAFQAQLDGKPIHPAELPEPWGFKLWKHLSDEYGMTLLESELSEIVDLAKPLSSEVEECWEYRKLIQENSSLMPGMAGSGLRECLAKHFYHLRTQADPGAVQVLLGHLEFAWTVIANAGGGDWCKETAEWRDAAAKFRDESFYLSVQRHGYQRPMSEESRKKVNAALLAQGMVNIGGNDVADFDSADFGKMIPPMDSEVTLDSTAKRKAAVTACPKCGSEATNADPYRVGNLECSTCGLSFTSPLLLKMAPRDPEDEDDDQPWPLVVTLLGLALLGFAIWAIVHYAR